MVSGDGASVHQALTRAVAAGESIAARQALSHTVPGDEVVLAALAHTAARGDTGAALATELLIETLDGSRIVHRFAGAALLDQSAVDDVVQDSLVSIAASIRSFEGTGKVTTWVHRIVRNRVVDHLRRQRATSPLPPEDLGPAERMSSTIATRTTIAEVLAALPPIYRDPVVLRDVEGLSYAEVSERLDRSIVKAQISRGRALVAARLADGDASVARGGEHG